MAVSVYIPTPFRRFTNNQSRVPVKPGTIGQILAELGETFPDLAPQLVNASGEVPAHLNVFVNEEEIRSLEGINTPVKDGDEVALIPAMAGGEGLPLTEEQVLRYSRHIILKEVGGVGQARLLRSKVLIIGAGGLGSPVAMYLAAAGVGTIGLVDHDRVDLTNLQRQILHHGHDVGRLKVESGATAIADLNPDVKVITFAVPLTSENALDIIRDFDVVVNGCDNFPTRYLLNDACVLLKKPLVDGSIFRFEGQATVFTPGNGCYRCLFPAPPPPGTVPSCAEAGVLGALAGLVGVVQAVETLKLILGIGENLTGRLLFVDTLFMEFRKLKVRRNPDCLVCGDHPTVTELIDYQEFCGVHQRKEADVTCGL